jgi:hypothetical protein
MGIESKNTSYYRELKKYPSVFEGCLILMNISLIKEEGFHGYSFK